MSRRIASVLLLAALAGCVQQPQIPQRICIAGSFVHGTKMVPKAFSMEPGISVGPLKVVASKEFVCTRMGDHRIRDLEVMHD